MFLRIRLVMFCKPTNFDRKLLCLRSFFMPREGQANVGAEKGKPLPSMFGKKILGKNGEK